MPYTIVCSRTHFPTFQMMAKTHINTLQSTQQAILVPYISFLDTHCSQMLQEATPTGNAWSKGPPNIKPCPTPVSPSHQSQQMEITASTINTTPTISPDTNTMGNNSDNNIISSLTQQIHELESQLSALHDTIQTIQHTQTQIMEMFTQLLEKTAISIQTFAERNKHHQHQLEQITTMLCSHSVPLPNVPTTDIPYLTVELPVHHCSTHTKPNIIDPGVTSTTTATSNVP